MYGSKSPDASDGDGDLILDHIFFNKIYRTETFQSERLFDETLEVKDFWGNPQSTWLSDHAGIRVELME